jgi:hypothetical protein
VPVLRHEALHFILWRSLSCTVTRGILHAL